MSDGSMNYVVKLYDMTLKVTISKLKQAEKLVRVKDTALNRKTSKFEATIDKAAAEQSRLLKEKKAQKEKFAEKFGELKGKSNELAKRDLEGSSIQERGDVSGIESTEDASELTTAPVALSPAPVAVNLAVSPTLPLGEDGTGLDPEDLVELSDSTAGEDGGDKSNEQSDGSMNYVVKLYDMTLKVTISKLKQAEKLVRVKDTALNRKTSEFEATIDKAAAEQSRLLKEKKAQKEKFAE
ncbi:hypothetical protein F2Q69_00059735 [Brassica cretica]|uniref:Uncharacterized protein n=1 Tax=Brassica cretica TaxID=69181 RepID=A0A8S9RCK0_BRACR|nr:hypothetical protein F2Q69_00059735 [Brassica cretica]